MSKIRESEIVTLDPSAPVYVCPLTEVASVHVIGPEPLHYTYKTVEDDGVRPEFISASTLPPGGTGTYSKPVWIAALSGQTRVFIEK